MNRRQMVGNSIPELDFLHQVYYGHINPGLPEFVDRAYRDFCRTWPITTREIHAKNPYELSERLQQQIAKLDQVSSSDAFDDWHSKTRGVLNIRLGLAQKWINMTLKYCWLSGGIDLDHISHCYKHAHVPLDSIVLKELFNESGDGWSTWEEGMSDKYKELQMSARLRAKESKIIPLELENNKWLESMGSKPRRKF